MIDKNDTRPIKQRFRDKWESTDELCPHCNQITKKSEGLTKQNLKNLVWGKPTFNDWFMFFIIVMTLFMAWAYQHDISDCQYVLNNIDDICLQQNNYLQDIETANKEITEKYNTTLIFEQLTTDNEIQEK